MRTLRIPLLVSIGGTGTGQTRIAGGSQLNRFYWVLIYYVKEKRAVNGTSEVALDCSDIQDLAEALLDNETLTEVERSDVAEHLASCDTCRAEYDMDSATKMLVHSRIPLVATPSTAYETIRHIIGEV